VDSLLEAPLKREALLLLSEDEMERARGIRILGETGQQLDLLEILAHEEEAPGIRMFAAAWLGINGKMEWIDHLAYISFHSEDDWMRRRSTELQLFALDYRASQRAESARQRKLLYRLKRLFAKRKKFDPLI
jgi:hypothetical protein